MQKNTKKKIAPVVVAVLVVAYVGPLVAMISYAAGLLGAEAGGWGVLPFLLLYAAVGGAVIVGRSGCHGPAAAGDRRRGRG